MIILKYICLGVVFLFFLMGGIGHFTQTEQFVAIMPPYMPFHLEAVYVSGVFELLGAFGILWAKSRRIAGLGLFALVIMVTPANIHMWLNAEDFPNFSMTYHYVGLTVQLVLLYVIWWSTKPAETSEVVEA
ncbi:MAG: DoxX family protein [Kordiimonadaceae bacterium]|nr:DoxX family protein [Kordiimonadaceae bacterium]